MMMWFGGMRDGVVLGYLKSNADVDNMAFLMASRCDVEVCKVLGLVFLWLLGAMWRFARCFGGMRGLVYLWLLGVMWRFARCFGGMR